MPYEKPRLNAVDARVLLENAVTERDGGDASEALLAQIVRLRAVHDREEEVARIEQARAAFGEIKQDHIYREPNVLLPEPAPVKPAPPAQPVALDAELDDFHGVPKIRPDPQKPSACHHSASNFGTCAAGSPVNGRLKIRS